MDKKIIAGITGIFSIFFAINVLTPLVAWAQVSSTSSIGQMIDASAGALTLPCSLGNFSLTSVDINSPAPFFKGYYLNLKTPDDDLASCGGTGVTVQDTRYDGGFILQVTASDYAKVGDPLTTIGVENLSVVTEQVSTSYNEDTAGSTSFTGSGDTFIVGSDDDDTEAAYTLPFTFTFYGTDYTVVYVCSNGEINFSSGECNSVGPNLAGRFTNTGSRIMPYYKDLTTDTSIDSSFGIFYSTPSPTQARFRWKAAPVENTAERVEFEVNLFDDGTDDTVSFDFGNMDDSGQGPAIGVTIGGAAGIPISNTYTESRLSQHETASDLPFAYALFIPGGFDFTEVKKPGTAAATAPQNGDDSIDLDYSAFAQDSGNPGTSLAIDLINGTVQNGCAFTPGRVGIYTVYPSYRLDVPSITPAGTYQNTVTYTISDSTLPFGGGC